MSEIIMDKGDIGLRLITPPFCVECEDFATHEIRVDFRSAGQQNVIGMYCKTCGEDTMKAMRDGLPSANGKSRPMENTR